MKSFLSFTAAAYFERLTRKILTRVGDNEGSVVKVYYYGSHKS